MNAYVEPWIADMKKTLDWFIELMGRDEWHRRRKSVVEYFHSIDNIKYTEEDIQDFEFEKKFAPIAVYSDWISWYMYLVESVFERTGCDDPSQSSRIYPFFAAIGRDIDLLKQMKGINRRLEVLFNEGQNKPDSTLYELVVAAHYARDHWTVEFLEDHPSRKTPDLEISKGCEKFWVECKRFAKVTEYAEKERLEWQKRVKHLFNAMRIEGISASAEVTFKVPLEETDEVILGGTFTHYCRSGMIRSGQILTHPYLDFKAIPLDLAHINSILEASPTRPTSPLMIELLNGTYELYGNYTQLIKPRKIEIINPDDKLFVLNQFYGSVYEAYIAKWDCVAPKSIDRKAKEINKMLSKALKQIPDEGDSIIHIGYETVTGPLVELRRQEKINQVIDRFNFGFKNIKAVFLNSFQLRPKLDGSDWAETLLFFEREKDSYLPKNLLLPPDSKEVRVNTHWAEDLINRHI
ncbi:hypothetical protein [Polluticaenibacter yanchengensis]|uniref:Restriction endonuclease n=1 Tax=Polluticaenibacter yanchengensis TaxID=3014562 RepID=A0ABT4UFD2_9BACT|nr:hypothetical protein [Chitinophagaceae bacterium LY-5]